LEIEQRPFIDRHREGLAFCNDILESYERVFPRRKDVSKLIIENNVSKDFPFYCSSFRPNCDAIFFYSILLFSCLYFLSVSYSNDDDGDRFARDIDTLYASISSCLTWFGKTLFICGSSKNIQQRKNMKIKPLRWCQSEMWLASLSVFLLILPIQ
jgi:hypothetical protein